MDLPSLDAADGLLADVAPSALAAMGTPTFYNVLELPEASAVCVLLIDGLGAALLDEHVADAPVLTELKAGTLRVGFPSTTAAGLGAIGTGMCSGEHGVVGYSFDVPDVGVLNALRWREHPWGKDWRDIVVPEQFQPSPTTFQRAAAEGVASRVVSDAKFTTSGLTRAVLRGAQYVGVLAAGDLAASSAAALSDGTFSYGHHTDLDTLGHLYGPGSPAWRMQLRQVDRLVESIVDGLPSGALLAVVADHGMVELDESVVDADASEALQAGVRALAGEPRARYVYAEEGAAADVFAAWKETLGERAWVVRRDEAIDAGWFGPRVADGVRPRIGDVVVAARGRFAVLRRQAEQLESALRGHHGSLTTEEQLVPLLLAQGS